jgi:hypothetical protein
VELLPGFAPAGVDVGRGSRAEDLPETLFAARLRVRGELDSAIQLDFLESFRKELDQNRTGFLGPVPCDTDGYPAEELVAQRNAARSFSKKPSSAL